MELKRYLFVLWKWWWLVLVAFITTFLSTLVFTYTSTPEYETEVRAIVSPAAINTSTLSELRASISALDKPVVANTYAEIGQSGSIIQSAWNQLQLPPDVDYIVSATVLPETSIIIITVTGPDPVLVERLATAVFDQTYDYVSGLYEVYDLILLDPATRPTIPVKPDEKLNLVFGLILGIGLGVSCAFLAEYLKTPLEQIEQLSIIDTQTGAYKSSYFLRCIQTEISRSQRTQRPFTVGIIRLDNFETVTEGLQPNTQQMLIKQVVTLLKQSLLEENLISQRSGIDTLAILLPESDRKTAEQIIRSVQTKVEWTAFEVGETGLKLNFSTSIGLAQYDLNGANPEDLVNQAEQSMPPPEKGIFG